MSFLQYIRNRAERYMIRKERKNECCCGFCSAGEYDDVRWMDASVYDRIASRVPNHHDELSSLKGFFRIIALFLDPITHQECCAVILGDHGELLTYDDAYSCTRYLMSDPSLDLKGFMISYRRNIHDSVENDYGVTLNRYDLLDWYNVF